MPFHHASESESSLEIDLDDRHNSSMIDNGLSGYSSFAGSGHSSSSAGYPSPSVRGAPVGGPGGQHPEASSYIAVRHRTLSSPVPMNVAMSPPVSKVPPSTPAAISSPISQEHLMPRPISPISRQKNVCCPKCNHSFLASIGSYTNLFANSSLSGNPAISLYSNVLPGHGLSGVGAAGSLGQSSASFMNSLNPPVLGSSGLGLSATTALSGLGSLSSGSNRLSNTMDSHMDQNMYSDDNLSNSSSSSNLLALSKQHSMDSDQIGQE